METFSALLTICAQKGQRRGSLMLSLICAWINGWVYNREAGDLRRHSAHYDVANGIGCVNDDVVTRAYFCITGSSSRLKRPLPGITSQRASNAGFWCFHWYWNQLFNKQSNLGWGDTLWLHYKNNWHKFLNIYIKYKLTYADIIKINKHFIDSME